MVARSVLRGLTSISVASEAGPLQGSVLEWTALHQEELLRDWELCKNMPEFIFVYGTLRKQVALNRHHLMASHCEYFSDGAMQGTLYEVCGYPGAIESSDVNDKVFGELYKMLDRKVLARLDDYEECSDRFPAPHEYIRKPLSITRSGGDPVVAWVYLYNHDVSKLEQLFI